MKAPTPITARCGYRCDLCPAYRENIRNPADSQRTSDGWFKYFGFRIPPDQVCCDGCRDERPEAHRIDSTCPIRPCALCRNVDTCGQCPRCGCRKFKSRDVTREGVEKRLGATLPPKDYRSFVLPYERSEMRSRPSKKKTPKTQKG
jgi:hypothetical protein